jgi:putative methyltransferase (TIGR04325 family)
MTRPWKQLLAPFVPPIAAELLRKRLYRFDGDYATWDEAARASSGYDAELILQRVKEAQLEVKSGRAAFERDSVTFDSPEYSWPLLAALLWVASRSGNRLRLIDVGGSLGSTYVQHRVFLDQFADLCWDVVEQPRFVACGRECFADARLKFFDTIGEARAADSPNTMLLSSVLPYLEAPYATLEEAGGFEFVIVDRTPFIGGSRDRLTVQTVEAEIYPARYPAWFFSKEKFLRFMTRTHRVVAEFPASDTANIPSEHLGFIFERLR